MVGNVRCLEKTGRLVGLMILVLQMVCCTSLLQAIEISLRVCDENGEPLTHVAQRVPFNVLVEVADDEPNVGEPVVEHREKLAQFERVKTSTKTTFNFYSGNRKTMRVYTYAARVDECGQYAIGPAYLVDGNRRIQSNAVQFSADACQQPVRDPYILLATVNKSAVYVGEQIILTVRLCWQEPVRDTAFALPALTDITAYQIAQTGEESHEYQGRVWQSRAWTFALFANKSGALMLPRLAAVCQTGFWLASVVKVYAAPITLTVKPLPAHAGPVDSVGQFESFAIKLDHATIRQSEAAILTLCVTGTGQIPRLFSQPLANMPLGLKLHESPCTIMPDPANHARWTVQREYVVQAAALGQFQIPGQHMTFFDPRSETYRTLATPPRILTVIADGGQAVPLHVESRACVLPLHVFCLLLGLLGLVAFVAYAWRQYGVLEKRITYTQLRRFVRRACRKQDARALYRAWAELVADKTHMSCDRITVTMMLDFGETITDDKKMQQQWKRYVLKVERRAFGAVTFDTAVGEESGLWVQRVKKLW